MSTPRITELTYWTSAERRFRALAGLPWCMWLDSAAADDQERFDILVADPYVTLRTRGPVTEIAPRGGPARESRRPPFELVREQLGDAGVAAPGLPFSGGAVGYFGYDLGRRLERIPAIAAADIAMPDLAIGLYDWAVVVDQAGERTWLVGNGRDERTFAEWPRLVARLSAEPPPSPAPFRVRTRPVSNLDRGAYAAAFHAVQDHIRRGDCYQVNLTQRFEAEAEGDAWHAYVRLREINPAPFAAYLDLPDGKVVCSSPERFLRLRDGRVETKPIKGTRPRSLDPERDRALAEELRTSAKDRAENVMIVDLLRNDLGKCCVPGSVRASKLFDIESFASVHQLVSTVEGRLAKGMHALDLVAACFPGGSITGAPKVAAMKIIEELEPQRRSVYCGSIGYVGFDGNMDTNIAIRTLVQQGGRVYTWAGGGVVADSNVDAEYQESLDKAAAMLAVMDGAAR
ncbi:MAG TPA: aminodeoxychorismate synthase component I [Gammaproteobacteria bacterium]|nr:aminodeoxychorismate synthase component I [Gammaproteobacteria bacterium]